ncbi:MAG TPA: hypothetical protein VLV48_02950 [Thermoanaerobaculia bacterium]|nr:hypothetical protein [Thermoanaerobaculia bacterium]
MKRLISVFGLLALLATGAFASQASNALLVAPDGTVFLIETVSGEKIGDTTGRRSALNLTIANGDESESKLIPASAGEGENSQPALAYDPATDTLFILWVRAPQITTSELLLTSYRDGQFGETTSLDLGVFRYRENLQVAITKFADNTVEVDGQEQKRKDPILAVHAVWWDTNGWTERARYALLQITAGKANVITVRDLIDVLGDGRNLEPLPAPESFDKRILHFPTIGANPALDRTDVVFGDPDTNRMYRLDLVPVAAHGVLRPPIGIRRGQIPAPFVDTIEANSTTTAVPHPSDPSSLMLYTISAGKIRYLVYEEGEWSEAKSIALEGKVTADVAIEALKRRLAER